MSSSEGNHLPRDLYLWIILWTLVVVGIAAAKQAKRYPHVLAEALLMEPQDILT